MTREHLFAAFFFAVLLFLLYQFYLILGVFIVPLSWAGLLALVFYPAQVELTRLFRGRPGLAAFVLTTLIITVVILPTILVGALVVNQSVTAYDRLRELIESGTLANWIDRGRAYLQHIPGHWLPAQFRHIDVDIPALALRGGNALSGLLVSQAAAVVRNVFLLIFYFFLTTFALFFFFRDGDRMANTIRALVPMEPEYKDAILTRLYDTVSAVVQSSLVIAAVQGVLCGFGYWVVGLPFAVLLGVASAIMSLLPSGSGIIWAPAALYLGVAESWIKCVILLAWCGIVVSTVDNVIRPLIIGERTQIPTLLLFFGMLGGLEVYGLLGLFVAPVLIATLVALLQIYSEQYGIGSGRRALAKARHRKSAPKS